MINLPIIQPVFQDGPLSKSHVLKKTDGIGIIRSDKGIQLVEMQCQMGISDDLFHGSLAISLAPMVLLDDDPHFRPEMLRIEIHDIDDTNDSSSIISLTCRST